MSMNMTDAEFNRITRFLKGRYGVDMSHKKEIVNGRLENYVRQGRWKGCTAYMDAVEHDATGELEKKLVDLLTTNHTFFMRETEHFDYMQQEVLPWLKQKEAGKKDLCIWCGASSTGEEPYTLAMLVVDFFGLDHDKWDTKILATDISTEALRHAVRGIYTEEQLRALPAAWKRRFFRKLPQQGCYMATDELKEEVLFREFNLMDPFPFKRRMHVVFLRNVMIYFDAATKNRLISKIYDAMEPGGYFFIGQTETLDRDRAPFQLVKPSIYRKQEGMR